MPQQKNILVVDDEIDILDLFKEEIEKAGFCVTTFEDGVEALNAMAEPIWDAVVMDVRMPRLSGIDALYLMQRWAPQIPVIIFSGQTSRAELQRAIDMGAEAVLTKPVDFNELNQLLFEITS